MGGAIQATEEWRSVAFKVYQRILATSWCAYEAVPQTPIICVPDSPVSRVCALLKDSERSSCTRACGDNLFVSRATTYQAGGDKPSQPTPLAS